MIEKVVRRMPSFDPSTSMLMSLLPGTAAAMALRSAGILESTR